MKKTKQLSLLLVTLIMIMGVCGCMSNNKQNSAETMREIALEYLNGTYEDTFTAEGYSSSSWAYEYSSITFTSAKYPDSIIEVRAYKNDDNSYTFKDNYFKCYMLSDGEAYYKGLLETNDCSVKVRFPSTIWSDELAGATSFNDWKNQGNCTADVFVITNVELSDNVKNTFVNSVASDKIAGTITFLTTSDAELLANRQLDDILNNQSELTESKSEYFVNSNFDVEN